MTRLLSIALLLLLFTVSAQAASQDIAVTWTAPTVNPASVTGYLIERSSTATGPFAQVGATPALTYTDPGLAQGANFCYRVTATSAGGNSPASPVSCLTTMGTPGAPGAPSLKLVFTP